ncbi:MAG TPA: glucoamylase family protein, partial [Blastocatellia bacterium]|nr:glucoamylase family protein [Blastocatellia bacterium]
MRIGALGRLCDRLAGEMDFGFLFAKNKGVFHIGYNVTNGRADNSFYDLLASEARLASFVAIAKGDVPHEHWFKLGRQMTSVKGHRALVSWSGTMFEYLMPLLVMRSYDETLLDETYRTVIARQIAYGHSRDVPWGVSESAYNMRDVQLNYQYGPFGVPGLGLKSGLSKDVVVSPYSTVLAGMIDPREAAENLRILAREGALGPYGFYEAIDYTKDHLPQDQRKALIRAYMAHHQGMIMVALDNVLSDQIMQTRFHEDAVVQSTDLLLQERIPKGVPITHPRPEEARQRQAPRLEAKSPIRRYLSADTPVPHVQILSNGVYSVTVSTAGSGYSTWGQLAVTRWREDSTRDHWGTFCYLRDRKSGAVWSAGYQPTGRAPQAYEVSFSEDKVEISRRDVGIETRLEVIVSTQHNAEIRRVSIANHSSRIREIEVTSYAEIVLATRSADAAHPAFGNLFIETEFIPERKALLARRRQRSSEQKPVWAFHVMGVEAAGELGEVEFETDRRQFLGRGRAVMDPIVISEGLHLTNTAGAVLDPIFSLRQCVTLLPNQTAAISFTTGVASSRGEAIDLVERFHDPAVFVRESRLSWTRSRIELRHLQMEPSDANLFQRLAGRIVHFDPSLRPRSGILAKNSKTQQGLWPYGISGDLPIILVRIADARGLDLLHQVLRAHEYLQLKGLMLDLVVLSQHSYSYIQPLQDDILALVRSSGRGALLDKPGGVYVRAADTMPDEDQILLETVARAVIVGNRGPLEEQLARKPVGIKLPGPFIPTSPISKYLEPRIEPPELSFFNGLGGFVKGGREYVIVLREGQWTPAPWINVISNEKEFGFQVSETGSGYTWSMNSGENRLTGWSNDPVSDPPSEAIYLRDEDTGATWTPTALPIRERGTYLITHGQGYTKFQHTSHGVSSELLAFVAVDAPVKVSVLSLHNQTERKRKVSVTAFVELVLAKRRETSAPFVVTEIDAAAGAILARNSYNNEFAGRVAFLQMEGPERSLTCDRKEFLGRNGQYAHPAALRRKGLSGRHGAGLDPCAVIQIAIELGAGQRIHIPILFGEGGTKEEAAAIVSKFSRVVESKAAFESVLAYWDQLLGAVEVRTPDLAMDILINKWLLYQAVSCRLWATSAFYQPGGAYGFRDQLQDVAALIYAKPELLRSQILRSASRQFREGDVQHWWHPATGAGVRTRISDDRLWLPFLTSYYVSRVGDESLLDEQVPFIEAPPLT